MNSARAASCFGTPVPSFRASRPANAMPSRLR